MRGRTFISVLLLVCCQHITAQDSLLISELQPIEILDSRDQEREIIRLQRNHFLSYPASFDDPSRLLMKFQGISVLNDQSNFIIYRGLPPHYSRWTIFGAEIVNPNHLSNTGTISDRTSRSAGGVNMFSGQVIGKMDYISPSSQGHIGNAIAGVADISFRRSYRDQYFVNAGLIGLEAGMERSSGSSDFIVNYRYSTLGVLSALGVDLGDETIRFQDLTSSLSFNNKFGGKLSIYGGWGKSSNDHDALADPSLYAEVKDLQDIYYDNKIGMLGINFNRNNQFEFTINYSNKTEDRESAKGVSVTSDKVILPDTFHLYEAVFSTFLGYRYGMINFTQRSNYHHSVFGDDPEWNYWLSRSSISLDFDLTSILDIRLRADGVYDTWNNEWTFEPGIFIGYGNWSADMRLNSMMISPDLFTYSGNQDLSRIKSANINVARRGNNWKIEAFYHILYDVPFFDDRSQFYTDLDNQDLRYTSESLRNSEAYIYGASFDLNTTLTESTKLKFNSTVFSNTGRDSKGNMFDNPYNFGYIFNVQGAKTFSFSENKYLQFSTAFHFRGGGYEHTIDSFLSKEMDQTIYEFTPPFAERLREYMRLDLRINYIIKSSNSKQVISLDIQNTTNKLNDAYHYYDPYTQEVLLKKQLGIIPILSYRREW